MRSIVLLLTLWLLSSTVFSHKEETPSPTWPTPQPTWPTPRPTTPSPTTPSPTTPSPTTPAPTTPSPTWPTPRPRTPSPITPSPTTPSPVTPNPTTDPDGKICYCPTQTTSVSPFTTASKSKSSKSKSKGSGSDGNGVGDCDCEGGIIELRFIYSGSIAPVEINIYYDDDKKDDVLCTFSNVITDQEIICKIEGTGYTDFDTNTGFDIIDSNGNYVCDDEYHTSCSQDIVGESPESGECPEIVVSGWRDVKTPDNDCDDGLEVCDCNDGGPTTTTTESPEGTPDGDPTTTTTTEEPQVTIGETCYCENDSEATPTPIEESSGSKSKSGSGGGLGVGDCECEKGMVELRLLYSGSNTVDIQFYNKDGDDLICEQEDVEQGQEAICNVNTYLDNNGDPFYEKLETETIVTLSDASSGNQVCSTEIHTSCSQDIVGTEGDGDCASGDIIVSGWRDGNDDTNDCDDGLQVCECNGTTTTPPLVTPTPTRDPDEEICYCPSVTTSASPFTTSAKSKSSKSKSKGSSSGGNGVGDCDCEGGIIELRFIYSGSVSPVEINVYYDDDNKDDVICTFSDVITDQEIICKIEGTGYTDFDTNTGFDIIDSNGNYVCDDEYHTSCSQDIVGESPESGECPEIVVSGWRDVDTPDNDCDDGLDVCDCDGETTTTETPEGTTTETPEGTPTTTNEPDGTTTTPPSDTPAPTTDPDEEICYCPSRTTSVSPFTTAAKSKSKSSKSKSKGSSSGGNGVGDCDCEGGIIELRFIYSGDTSPVEINIYYDDDEKNEVICTFFDVITDQEIICKIEGTGYTDFDTNTGFDIIDSNGNYVCDDEYHTSCSQDIVGESPESGECPEIVVSGWRDLDTPDNECDDGLEVCDCDGETTTTEPPEGTEEPTTPAPTNDEEEICYCLAITTSASPFTTSAKSKSKSSKSKSKGSSSGGNGVGDCDCEGGIIELRFIYSGSVSPVEINVYYDDDKKDDVICTFVDVVTDEEIICKIEGTGYTDFDTNTGFDIIDSNGNYVCDDEYHTSCSQDIVGESPESGECPEIVVSGWRDVDTPDNDCDDGLEVCDCDETTTSPTTLSPTTEGPTTDTPTTDSPTTYIPTTSRPTTGYPTMGVTPSPDPTTVDPTTAFPTTDNPTTYIPTTNGPITVSPTTTLPTTNNPTTDQPTTDKPTTDTPTTDNPTTNIPTSNGPTTVSPTTDTPTTAFPTTDNPTTDSPTTDRPTTDSPTTTDPTTALPTTSAPTTADPSTPPTSDPTTTLEPTSSPTTSSPTTADPTTTDPTTNPTKMPTTAPSPAICPPFTEEGRKQLDAVILVDTDGNYLAANNNFQCNRQQGFVADALTIIKSEESVPNGQVPNSRVGVVEFDRNEVRQIKSLFDSDVNGLSDDVTGAEMYEYLELIEGRCGDNDFTSPNLDCDDSDPTQLYEALEYVRNNYFESVSDPAPTDIQRDRYILIFNNCRLPNNEVERICGEFEDYIRTGSTSPNRGENQSGDGINVAIINGGNEDFSSGGDDYILCLTEYDDSRIAVNPNRGRNDFATILEETWVELVCNELPTPAPTSDPTQDPIEEISGDCDIDFNLDIVFLIDTSCAISVEECENQQDMIAEVFSTLRGPDLGPNINSNSQQTMKVRVAYVEMGSDSINILVNFAANPSTHQDTINTGKVSYNGGSVLLEIGDNNGVPDTLEQVNERYVEYIKDRKSVLCDATELSNRGGSPNLDEALNAIMIGGNSLFDDADSANLQRDREILIFSNCAVTDAEREEICDRYEDEIRNPVQTQNGRDNGINVNMINTPPNDQSIIDALSDSDADEYLSCLTEYDPEKRIFNNKPQGGEPFDPDVDDFVVNSICDEPTPAPTGDPTSDPTQDPVIPPKSAVSDLNNNNMFGDYERVFEKDDPGKTLMNLVSISHTKLLFGVMLFIFVLNVIICSCKCCKKNKGENKKGYVKNALEEEEISSSDSDESDIIDVDIECDEEELI